MKYKFPYKIGPATQKILDEGPPPHLLVDSQNRYRTTIIEELQEDYTYDSIYTMKTFEYKGLASAKIIYLLCNDEYDAAMTLVGSWEHWCRLLRVDQFLNGVRDNGLVSLKAWREEKRLMEESYAKEMILQMAHNGNYNAAKLLYEGKKLPAGRPSKDQIVKQATILAEKDAAVKQDLRRIRLATSNGKRITRKITDDEESY